MKAASKNALAAVALILAGSCGPASDVHFHDTYVSFGNLGCGAPAHNLLEEADSMLRDQQYEEAEKTIKQHLLANPNDAGGHFLLGRVYSYPDDERYLVLAEGEFRTALFYFEQSGKKNPIPRFEDPTYFELITHIEIAKIYLRQLDILFELKAPLYSIRNRLKAMRDELNEAREVDPDAPDLKHFESIYEELAEQIGEGPSDPPSQNGPAVVPLRTSVLAH
jgi:tetratricopeptide (TPR) repeat protein